MEVIKGAWGRGFGKAKTDENFLRALPLFLADQEIDIAHRPEAEIRIYRLAQGGTLEQKDVYAGTVQGAKGLGKCLDEDGVSETVAKIEKP
jgi:hypothetical protein